MTVQAYDIMTVTPSAAVADGGTIVFTYPASRAAASYNATGALLFADAHGTLYRQVTGGFSISYGATTATVTYDGSTTIPAGCEVSLQAPLAQYAAPGTAITGLTAATGTASDTLADVTSTPTQTLINNNFKSLSNKVNAILAALRGADIAT